jgi:hypothetical protein
VNETDTTTEWANGVTVKRTTSGYTWTIAVAAESSGLEAMRTAAATARRVDEELTAAYGPPKETRRGEGSPLVHQPPRDAGEPASEGARR